MKHKYKYIIVVQAFKAFTTTRASRQIEKHDVCSTPSYEKAQTIRDALAEKYMKSREGKWSIESSEPVAGGGKIIRIKSSTGEGYFFYIRKDLKDPIGEK